MNGTVTAIVNKLSPSERQLVKLLLLRIKQNDTQGLDIKLLSGHANLFRVRKDRLRIVYYKSSNTFLVLQVDRRGYKPYAL